VEGGGTRAAPRYRGTRRSRAARILKGKSSPWQLGMTSVRTNLELAAGAASRVKGIPEGAWRRTPRLRARHS